MAEENSPKRIIRKPELLARVQLSDATVWRLERAGQFPRRIQLGGNSIGWLEHELDNWFNERAASRGN